MIFIFPVGAVSVSAIVLCGWLWWLCVNSWLLLETTSFRAITSVVCEAGVSFSFSVFPGFGSSSVYPVLHLDSFTRETQTDVTDSARGVQLVDTHIRLTLNC